MSSLEDYAQALLGLRLTDEQLGRFARLTDLLLEWNQRFNLTAISDRDEIVIKHYLDSLTLTRVLPPADDLRLIDVGAGAGFPGLPLAIALPRLQVTLLDATKKKLRFIDQAGAELGLQNVRTLHARAEDAGRDPNHRETYDIVAARAVVRLPALMEYTLPLAKLSGQVIAMAGRSAYDDANSAAKAMDVLGGELFSIEETRLPTLDHARHLILIDKVDKTPRQYPRRAGTPTRDPIQ